MEPVLSVMMVTYGGGETALDAIHELVENTDAPFELLVVDNASADGTGELLESGSSAPRIRNQDNIGFAPASNQGAALASAAISVS